MLYSLFAAAPLAAQFQVITEEVIIEASLTSLWQTLGDFSAAPICYPQAVSDSTATSASLPGDLRQLTLSASLKLTEQLQRLDPVNHTLSWSLNDFEDRSSEQNPASALLPLASSGYRMRIALQPQSIGATRVIWEVLLGAGDGEGKGPAAELTAQTRSLMQAGLQQLSARYQREPEPQPETKILPPRVSEP